MQIAEDYAMPVRGELGGAFARVNDFNDEFFIRWGKIDFDVFQGSHINLKIILKAYSNDNIYFARSRMRKNIDIIFGF
ncbi:MAG: hypothetical protein L3J59_09725 [Methylococcaceae bacterium]|nr:hypothetical protein [Methylococcaceae bacterium]